MSAAIIMAPTRELCLQIGKECRKFAKPLGLRAVCVYGGTGTCDSYITQREQLITLLQKKENRVRVG